MGRGIKANGRIIKRRGKALRCGSMGVSIMGSLRVVRRMGKGFLGGKMGLNIQVNLKKIIFTGKESTNRQEQSRTRAVGKIAKRMGRGLSWGVGRNLKEIL